MAIVEVPLSGGETLLVHTLSPFVRQALLDKARALHPNPDPEPYRKPLANAFDESLLEPAESNPEYVKALAEAQRKIFNAFSDMVLRTAAFEGVKGEERTTTLTRYGAQLAAIRGQVSGLPEDDWQATVYACLLTTNTDIANVVNVTSEAVTQEGIRAASARFRGEIQRRARPNATRKQGAPGVPESAGEAAAPEG